MDNKITFFRFKTSLHKFPKEEFKKNIANKKSLKRITQKLEKSNLKLSNEEYSRYYDFLKAIRIHGKELANHYSKNRITASFSYIGLFETDLDEKGDLLKGFEILYVEIENLHNYIFGPQKEPYSMASRIYKRRYQSRNTSEKQQQLEFLYNRLLTKHDIDKTLPMKDLFLNDREFIQIEKSKTGLENRIYAFGNPERIAHKDLKDLNKEIEKMNDQGWSIKQIEGIQSGNASGWHDGGAGYGFTEGIMVLWEKDNS